ncbi:sodium/potassium-transporting ATPase subunit beta-3-like [Xiphophorus couchianus]|uniref:sodium/potassium-transporting ATPase subunit beta-3-like n=1 Tax=Xiphophorus couchianus TaxID=32473 RepID=UPI0010170D66|nr:sodium/potassium-transporting ATPase subunit beta-3-like [Xiphophorus couchianus]
MSSAPEAQNQEPNQEPPKETNAEQKPEEKEAQGEEKDAAKEEVKVEEKEEKTEEKKKEEKKKKEKKKEEKDKKNKKKKEQKKEEKKESWKDFIYNPRTGEFLGRTASSWGLIFLFYLIFYGVLTGMFILTIWVMLQTLDDAVPRHQDRLDSPGLVFRPHAVEISYNRSDPAKFNPYVQQLHDLLQQYNDSIQEGNDLCLVGEYTDQDDQPKKKVCQFKRSNLRQCSGLPDTSFGYAEGQPCVILKLNRVIGLKPEGDPYINCTAKRNTPLQMIYFPPEGRLDKMFFPYYGKIAHPDYVQPLVAVKLLLTKEDYSVEQTVECKVEGSNLRNSDERDKYLGRVTFRVTVFQ